METCEKLQAAGAGLVQDMQRTETLAQILVLVWGNLLVDRLESS